MLLLLRVCGRTKTLLSETVAAFCANPGRVLQAVCSVATIASARAAPLTAADSASKLLAQVWTLEDVAYLFVAFADVVGGSELPPATVDDLFALMCTHWFCMANDSQVGDLYSALTKLLTSLPFDTKLALCLSKFPRGAHALIGSNNSLLPKPALLVMSYSAKSIAGLEKLYACMTEISDQCAGEMQRQLHLQFFGAPPDKGT